MNRLKQVVILANLIERLREHGSWCGETHVQKAGYILQEVLKVPTRFEYILYKHGPFSFDMRDELTAMRADGLLAIEPVPPYGPRLKLTPLTKFLQKRFPKTLGMYEQRIAFVAEQLGGKGVQELEQLATAIYITLKGGEGARPKERAEKLNQLKPHIAMEEALQAVNEADRILREAKSVEQT